MMGQPVFIAGPGRSGTTLMRTLLDAHPQLNVYPVEVTKFLCRLQQLKDFPLIKPLQAYQKIGPHLGTLNFGGVLRNALGTSDLDLRAINADVFNAQLQKISHDSVTVEEYFNEAFNALNQAYPMANQSGLQVMDITDPIMGGYLDNFNDARIIYCTRHPFTCFNSYKKNYYKNVDHLRQAVLPGYMLRKFFEDLHQSFDELNRFHNDPRVLVVKLEDLQSSPQAIMQRVSDFLQIDYVESMLEPTLLGQAFGGNMLSKEGESNKVVQIPFSDKLLTQQERYLIGQVIPCEKFYDLKFDQANAKKMSFNQFLESIGNWNITQKSFPVSLLYQLQGWMRYAQVHKGYVEFIEDKYKEYELETV